MHCHGSDEETLGAVAVNPVHQAEVVVEEDDDHVSIGLADEGSMPRLDSPPLEDEEEEGHYVQV